MPPGYQDIGPSGSDRSALRQLQAYQQAQHSNGLGNLAQAARHPSIPDSDDVEMDEVAVYDSPRPGEMIDSVEAFEHLKETLKYGKQNNFYRIFIPPSGLYRMITWKRGNVLLATVDDKAIRINKDFPLIAHKREIQRFAAEIGRSCLKVEFSDGDLKIMFRRKQNSGPNWRVEPDPAEERQMRQLTRQMNERATTIQPYWNAYSSASVSVNAFDEILF